MRDLIRSVGMAVALMALVGMPCAEAASSAKETAVRAAFLFRLAFFVSWPEQAFAAPDSPVTICLSAHEDALARLLAEQTATRTVQERPIAVVQLDPESATHDCHIVYGDRSGFDATNPGHTLIVVGSLEDLDDGAALALVREESAGEARLLFYARRDHLHVGEFSVSSKLLQLVRFHESQP